MPPEIPEYYRHLAERKPASPPPEGSKGPPEGEDAGPEGGKATPEDGKAAPQAGAPRGPGRPAPATGAPSTGAPAARMAEPPPPLVYRGHTFVMGIGEDWRDQTIHVLAGPVTDGIQHNITVTMSADLPEMPLVDFADLQMQALEEQLKGCRLLLREPIHLDGGVPAYRAIFVWWPAEERRLYQEQIYVLHGTRGYILTATFTRKTRKTLGPQVERMMRSFQPLD